jgi:lysophospholipase L1-like esterase
MKKDKLIYTIYLTAICLITIYFSLGMVQKNVNIPFIGKFVSSLKEGTISSAYSADEKRLIEEIEKYASVPIKSRIESHKGEYRNLEGFRDYQHEIVKPNNTFRIIALGDSFTEGAWVPINDTWPKRLEMKLNQLNFSRKFEVFNFGKGGAGTLEEVELFKEKGLKYNPDMVILLFYPNDWENSIQIKTKTWELWQMYKNGSFKFSAIVEKKIKELNASEEDVSRLVYYVAISKFWDYVNQKGLENVWKENVESPLKELIDICRQRKIELVVVSIDLTESMIKNQHELLNNFLLKYEVPFLDVTPYFPWEKNELRVPDMHLSEKGHELLSTKLLEFLIQTNKIIR